MGNVCTPSNRRFVYMSAIHSSMLMNSFSDFADQHPSAFIIGSELSAIQPSSVPPNVQFEIDDCEDEWLYTEDFDFVHVRGLYGCVSDWDRFYEQAFKHV